MVDEYVSTLVARYGVTGLLHRRIVIVDDDAPNLAVLQAVLEGDYEVRPATSGSEALEILEAEHVDVVVTDQRMPEMTGVELLERVRSLHPDVAGIVLTGFTDSPAIMSAINRAQVFRFLTKPWDAPDIMAAVEQACDHVAQRRAILRLVDLVASRNDELAAMLQELKATQQQVLHLDRLGTIGRLTSGVTHDLRNFLTGLALLEEDIETREVPADLRETVGIGLAGVRNLLSTLESMGQFASSGRLGVERAAVAPAVVARDATTVLRMDMEFRRRNVVARVEEGLPDIVADRQKLVQVLVNLIRNAVQATQKGQSVTIQVATAPGGGVVFAVEDEGPGVPPEVREKLFNPFVSSKGSGGMGMGLYMARLVAESHGGWIACVDRPGGGARFELVVGTGSAA